MNSKLRLWVLLCCSFGLAAGCTHSIRRAALVPHQQPIAHSGARAESAQISFGSAGLLSSAEPQVAANQNVGLVIPRWQGQGALRLPMGEAMSVGFHIDYGLDKGSIALSEDQPDPQGDTMGAAVSLFYTATISDTFDLGVGGQLWLYSIPYVEYDTCLTCLGGPYTDVEHDRELIPVLSVGILPTLKVSPTVSVFGGLNVRNHPTVEKGEVTIGPESDFDEEVESGPPNAIASLGADVLLSEQFKVTAYLHRPISAVPVSYGVTAGFMLTFVAKAKRLKASSTQSSWR